MGKRHQSECDEILKTLLVVLNLYRNFWIKYFGPELLCPKLLTIDSRKEWRSESHLNHTSCLPINGQRKFWDKFRYPVIWQGGKWFLEVWRRFLRWWELQFPPKNISCRTKRNCGRRNSFVWKNEFAWMDCCWRNLYVVREVPGNSGEFRKDLEYSFILEIRMFQDIIVYSRTNSSIQGGTHSRRNSSIPGETHLSCMTYYYSKIFYSKKVTKNIQRN